MKTVISEICLLAGLVAAPVAALFAAEDAPKKASVAVAKVEVLPTLKAQIEKENRSESMMRIVEAISDNLGSAIQATRRLEVVTINDLDVVVKAIERGENVLASEEFAPALKNFDYAFSIKIDDYQDFRQEREFSTLGETLVFRKIRLGAVSNLINARTGTIAESPNIVLSKNVKVSNSDHVKSVGGEKTDEIIAQLTRDFCRKVAFTLADLISPPRVLSVSKNGKTVTINKGAESDIEKGQIYEIFALGEEMIDPDTGESFGAEEEYVGKIKISRITAKFSQASVLENNGIEKGCIARPQQKESGAK